MDEQAAMLTKMFRLWLIALRKRLRMTQTELAQVLGIRLEPISRWESGHQLPSGPHTLMIMALATPDEQQALIDKAADALNDSIIEIHDGSGAQTVHSYATCATCGRALRLRDFTTAGWASPPRVRESGDPYAVRECQPCQANR